MCLDMMDNIRMIEIFWHFTQMDEIINCSESNLSILRKSNITREFPPERMELLKMSFLSENS